MKKLIEIEPMADINCDNPGCGYTEQVDNSDLPNHINRPCPECGCNLLTYADCQKSIRAVAFANWINKWFSWIGIFMSSKRSTISVHFQEGKVTYEKLD